MQICSCLNALLQRSCKGPISFRSVIKPNLLLTAIKFEFSVEHKFNISEVDFAISFGRSYDSSSTATSAFTFTDLVLHGATLNFDRLKMGQSRPLLMFIFVFSKYYNS